MAGKLSKSDYEKALSAEYGFPVFLRDDEYERLSVSKPLSKPAASYQDPFGYLDDAKKAKADPDHWTTAKGQTYKSTHKPTTIPGTSYNKDHGRAPKAAPPVLAGVPTSNASAKKPAGPSKIEKIAPPSAPNDMMYAKGTPLTAETSMPVGVEYLNGVGEPFVEDLGGDTAPATQEEKIAHQQQYEMLKAADDIGALPTTFKGAPPAYAPKSMLPQWQSDEDEVNTMLNRYAALGM